MMNRSSKHRFFWALQLTLFSLLSVVAAGTAHAQAEAVAAAKKPAQPDITSQVMEWCETPKRTINSVFSPDPEQRSACLAKVGSFEAQEVAQRLRSILDATESVEVDKFSNDPNYKNSEGEEVVVVSSRYPGITISKFPDGRWLWPEASLRRAREIYLQINIPDWARNLPEWTQGSFMGLRVYQGLALLVLIAIGLIARTIIRFVVANRLRKLSKKLNRPWLTPIVDAAASPGATLIMALILAIAYPQLGLPVGMTVAITIVLRIMVMGSVVWALYHIIDVFSLRWADIAAETDTKLDDQLVPMVRKLAKIILVISGVLLVLQNLNVNVGAMIATLGVGSIAIAFAAKDMLANFFGSIVVFIDKPFQIGDWVVVDGAEGVVEEVGFRSTRVRTFYNSLMTLPNGVFTEKKIDNYGARQYRRTFVTIGITYDTTPDQMQAFVEGIRAVIQANPYTRKDYYEVHMSGFGDSSLNVMLYFFFKTDSWSIELRERHNVFLEVMRLAQALKIGFAFPTQTLHLDYVNQPGTPRDVPQPMPNPEMAQVIKSYGPEGGTGSPFAREIAGGYYATAAAGTHKGGDADAE
jgi:MscS family membrane protein